MKINYLSETAVTLTFGDNISVETNREVLLFTDFIRQKDFLWLKDLIPAYASVSIFVKPEFYNEQNSLIDFFRNIYQDYLKNPPAETLAPATHFQLEVGYNGIDLPFIAENCKLSVEEVIKIHTLPVYTVAMIGFTPGFPYLLGLDQRLFLPRKETPNLRVEKGSLAIGGMQTGIYPHLSPGGWHILGTVKKELFNPNWESPSLLRPGDTIKFIAK